MRQFEVTFIVDPVLSKEEIQTIAKKYIDLLGSEDCSVVKVDEIGLRQLAYPINKRNSGVYYCIEFQSPDGKIITALELDMRRNEQLLRFLTVSLDKHGVKYNADKRAGLIGKKAPVISKRALPVETPAQAPAPAATPKAVESPVAPATEPVAIETPVAPGTEPVAIETPVVPATEPVAIEAPEAPATEPVAIEAPEVPMDTPADDLKRIEGVGPKIAELLNGAGIQTFADLANTDADRVREILAEGGSQFTMHDPSTWAQQAQLAAAGQWDELKELQDKLQGGRPE